MRKVAITTNSAQFEIRRNKLIDEYLREVHPLWLECQRQMEQASSHSWSDHLISEFRGKIRPRLEELFTEIARLKLGFRIGPSPPGDSAGRMWMPFCRRSNDLC